MQEKKVVPFKCNEGISYSLTQRLLEKVESFSIDVIGTLKNLGTTSTIATQTCEPTIITELYYRSEIIPGLKIQNQS